MEQTSGSTNPRGMHGVDGRVVIVTGAGRGIGRGIAHHLGRGGASVVVAEWKRDTMQRTVDELTELGVPVLGVECDINDRDQIDTMVAATVTRFGRVDAIVNNAQTFRPMA
ncbi:MAG: SDR family NAD(P)-dependent oxidoreductase, partial [Acidimicrobiia bacterium]